ncbi:MAG: cupin domain-containing protein [Fimbriimonas sp.]|nr:cupin domain-containing protein [Fimbriimonas sp.]
MVKHSNGSYRWQGIDVHPYKEDGTIFKSVTRQTLFHGGDDLNVELRYFEVGISGYTTLERHQHAHLVTIIRGCGRVLIGDKVIGIGVHDVVQIPPFTWHQFQPSEGEVLGFLCMVNPERDRPQRPTTEDVESLNANEDVAAFIHL